MRFAILFALLCMPWAAMAGTFQLTRTGDNYTLEANQARLSDILAELDRQEPASLRFFGAYDELVSATYRDVSLDTLDSIAIKFSARPSDIKKLNPNLPPDGTVAPGMVTRIPWQ